MRLTNLGARRLDVVRGYGVENSLRVFTPIEDFGGLRGGLN